MAKYHARLSQGRLPTVGKPYRRLDQRQLQRASEESLLEHFVRAREQGDIEGMRATISVFINGRYRQLLMLALNHLPDEDALDVVGASIISALESLEPGRAGFRGETSAELGAWLCSIVRRRIADHYRRREREIKAESLHAETEDGTALPGREPVSLDGDPADQVVLLDAHERVLSKLSPLHRRVITVWWEERLAASEIVERLPSLTVTNVHQIISRYRARMREQLNLGVET